VADDNRPWRSRLLLEQGEELPASHLLEQGSDARLAVLASCASARGKTLSGEGVQSLSTALLAGGVPSVVATLWPVDDEVTFELMRHFYNGLERGSGAAEALRDAQEAIREAPGTGHPFYWAGFVVEGDPDTSVRLTTRRRFWLPLLGLAAATLGIFWVYLRRPA
jgi:CHAT domain-containing protein